MCLVDLGVLSDFGKTKLRPLLWKVCSLRMRAPEEV